MLELAEGEKVVYEIRRHWYVLVVESITLALFLFIPWLVFLGLDVVGVSLTAKEIAFFAFVVLTWFFVSWLSFMVIWTNYYLDVWIVTNMRIIDIEQYSLFSRDVSEFRLDRIQDVTIEVKGILPTLLRFGNVDVQTAGETYEFQIKSVPNPYEVRDIIIREHDRAVEAHRGEGVH